MALAYSSRGPTRSERPLSPHLPLLPTLASAEAPAAAADMGAVAIQPSCPCDYSDCVAKTTHSYYRIHLTTIGFPAKPHAAVEAARRWHEVARDVVQDEPEIS